MKNLEQIFQKIIKQATIDFNHCKNSHDLEKSKNHLMGKKSELMKVFNNLEVNQKKEYSQKIKIVKMKIENIYQKIYQKKQEKKKEIKIENIENTVNKNKIKFEKDQRLIKISKTNSLVNWKIGEDHPLNKIIEQIHQFCNYMNWKFIDCENLTNVDDNFTLLNIGINHPARKKEDCFYIDEENVLRTHATNNTAKILKHYQKKQEKEKLTYTIGNVFRNDTDDPTHLPQFTQFDACLIENNLTLAHLKGVLIQFCEFLFEEKIIYRFRSSYFPFTEPSLEMDIHCTFCQGKSCKVCKNEGWVELLGGGVINPEVLKKCNINEKKIILAFGVGIERLAMLKYKIKDIRRLYKNNLEQKQK